MLASCSAGYARVVAQISSSFSMILRAKHNGKKPHRRSPPVPIHRPFPPPESDPEWTIPAIVRRTGGTWCRRLRRGKDVIPAVICGGGAPPIPIDISFGKMMSLMTWGRIFTRPLRIEVQGGHTHDVLARNIQFHLLHQNHPVHATFYRMSETQRFLVWVPVALTGLDQCSLLVDDEHQFHINIMMKKVPLMCYKDEVPPVIEVDISKLHDWGRIRINDLKESLLALYPSVEFHHPEGTKYADNYMVLAASDFFTEAHEKPEAATEATSASTAGTAAAATPAAGASAGADAKKKQDA